MTTLEVTPEQLRHTCNGNLCWKIDYVLGQHLAQFGERPLAFYEAVVDAVFSRALASTPATTEGREGHEIILAMCEGVHLRKLRLQQDFANYSSECASYWRDHDRLREERKAPRLDAATVAAIARDSAAREYVTRVDRQSLEIDPARFSLPDNQLLFKEKGTRLLAQAVEEYGLRHVVNIGARIDQASCFLARRYPEVRFTSLDFQANLREQNEAAFGDLPANWDFVSGYALDLFEDGLRADAVFMMATSVLFSVEELRAYVAAFGKAGVRAVVLSESWASPLHEWDLARIPTPEEIDPETPYIGGSMLNAHHNYPRHLEAGGYRVPHSAIIDDYLGGGYNILQVIAVG